MPLEERQKLYAKVMPRLTVFSEPEKPRTADVLRDRLRKKGISDEEIDKALEGLVL